MERNRLSASFLSSLATKNTEHLTLNLPNPPPQARYGRRSILRRACIYPTPPLRAGCETRSILKWSTAGLNSKFLFCFVFVVGNPTNLLIAPGKRIDWFISFLMELVWSETQIASFRIWTLVAGFISNDSNYFVMSPFLNFIQVNRLLNQCYRIFYNSVFAGRKGQRVCGSTPESQYVKKQQLPLLQFSPFSDTDVFLRRRWG